MRKRYNHVIISANLSEHEEERLLKTLKKHHAATGYTLDYLKGVSPILCQHKTKLEEDAKPVVDHQRRLNQRSGKKWNTKASGSRYNLSYCW